MKQFNQSINITIEVDAIATALLNQMAPDFKHRELVVETIIGRALNCDNSLLGMIYNSVNGFKRVINFEVGEQVGVQSLSSYTHVEEEGKFVRKYQPVTTAEITEINPYNDNTLRIKYFTVNDKGAVVNNETTIDHVHCSKMPVISI